MRTLSRGFRSFRRHWARNLIIVILLAVCLTFSLSMLAVKLAADQQVKSVQSTVGNYAEVSVSSDALMAYFEQQRTMTEAQRAAQARSMTAEEELANRAETLVPESVTDTFSQNSQVRTYDKLLDANVAVSGLTSTSVTPMFELRGGGASTSSGGGGYQFEGNTDASALADFVDGNKTIVDGQLYTYADYKNANPVVVIEQDLANTNNLKVGDTIEATINGASGSGSKMELTVIGIYQTQEAQRSDSSGSSQAMTNPRGSTFYAPLSVVQKLNATPGYVSTGSYYFDSVKHTDEVTAAFTNQVGDGSSYALTTDLSSYQSIADPLIKVGNTSLIGLAGALGACALIVLLAMGITIGSRTKELGVLKALGATNRQVIGQYAIEVVCITLVAIVLAMGATAIIGQHLGNWMLSGNQTTTNSQNNQIAAGPVAISPGTQGNGSSNAGTNNGTNGGTNNGTNSGNNNQSGNAGSAPSGNMQMAPPGGGDFSFRQRLSNQVMNTTAEQQASSIQVVYRGSLFLYGILILIIISLLGMAVPIIWIVRIRPARILSME